MQLSPMFLVDLTVIYCHIPINYQTAVQTVVWFFGRDSISGQSINQ